MTPPEDPSKVTASDSVKSPNLNKSAGSAVGGASGGTVGVIAVLLIHLYYKVDLSPEMASVISAAVTASAGVIGTFFAPLITAAQQVALRRLNDDEK